MEIKRPLELRYGKQAYGVVIGLAVALTGLAEYYFLHQKEVNAVLATIAPALPGNLGIKVGELPK